MNRRRGHVCCSGYGDLTRYIPMSTRPESMPYPDSTSLVSELQFGDRWDVEAVSALIRSKCGHGETPAFLYVGRKEAGLLRAHLAEVFGTDAVSTLRDNY